MAAPAPARLLLRAAAAAFSRRWLLSALPAAGTGPSCSAAAVRASRPLGTSARAARSSEDKITVHFINRDGDKLTAKGKPGDSLLDVVVDNNLDIDGFGACEGTLACSTCHLIFEEHVFEKLDAITDEEMDMLDLAYGLTETKIQVTEMEEVPNLTGVAACWEAIKVKLTLAVRSRLGCQICLKKSMDNMTVRVPEAVADVRQSVDLSKNS